MNKCLVFLSAVVFSFLECNDNNMQAKRKKAEEEVMADFQDIVTPVLERIYDSVGTSEKELSSAERFEMQNKRRRVQEKALSMCVDDSLYPSDEEQKKCLQETEDKLTELERNTLFIVAMRKAFDESNNE